jgi:transcriptional regulator with XRE-family HTH domain
MQEATRKVILRLKEARAQKNLTYQDIVDACEAQNESISLSTVRRIFSKGSEDGADYRPYTINALFRAVIGTEDIALTDAEEAALTETEKEAVTENSALKAVVEMKDATIADLQQQIESLIAEKESLEQKVSVLQIRLETMTDIIRVSVEAIGKR